MFRMAVGWRNTRKLGRIILLLQVLHVDMNPVLHVPVVYEGLRAAGGIRVLLVRSVAAGLILGTDEHSKMSAKPIAGAMVLRVSTDGINTRRMRVGEKWPLLLLLVADLLAGCGCCLCIRCASGSMSPWQQQCGKQLLHLPLIFLVIGNQ
mmetsp:Transcript_21979/g.47916  ORF Transcript_21979/g.47916 Transcript_21979/m.47916 type:complete len:150 (+) Transcript_21979:643-1092(+)